jgi:hypothetical protein
MMRGHRLLHPPYTARLAAALSSERLALRDDLAHICIGVLHVVSALWAGARLLQPVADALGMEAVQAR